MVVVCCDIDKKTKMGVVRCDSAGLVVVVMVFGFLIQTCYCDISVLCYVFLKCCCCS